MERQSSKQPIAARKDARQTVCWLRRGRPSVRCARRPLTLEIATMKQKENPTHPPKHDYSQARRAALSWLGDRYLLAEPVTRRVAPKHWHDVRRIGSAW